MDQSQITNAPVSSRYVGIRVAIVGVFRSQGRTRLSTGSVHGWRSGTLSGALLGLVCRVVDGVLAGNDS